MAILRAGPFANSSDSFLDEPKIAGDIAPVNCANDTSSLAWPWKYVKIVSEFNNTHTGCELNPASGEYVPTFASSQSDNNINKTATEDFSISSFGSSNHITSVDTILTFAYQAAKSFEIKITFEGLASGDSTLDQPSFMGFFDSQSEEPIEGFPSVSGSVTRTLPASIVPIFYTATLITASSIAIADACSPKASLANTSATLSVEFL
mgnify:CR=1 FL=1